jgi:hypothetical protein
VKQNGNSRSQELRVSASPILLSAVLLSVCLFMPALSAIGDEADDREALLLELEYVNASGLAGDDNIQVAAATLITEFFERREFESAWRDPAKAAELLELVRASRAEGK